MVVHKLVVACSHRQSDAAINEGADWVLRTAAPPDYWPLADLHCEVFMPDLDKSTWKGGLSRIDRLMALQMNRSLEIRKVGRAVCFMAVDSSFSDSSSTSDSSSNSVSNSSSGSSSSFSSVSSFSSNGTGSSAISSSRSSSVKWHGPKAVLALAHWAAIPQAKATLGLSFEEHGVLGVAQLDSFGDIIPPKALSPKHDGAFGWVRREGICYVSNVAVSSQARRKGIARRLMAEAEAAAADWGFRCVSLHCDPANTAAWKLYRDLGYRRVALESPLAPYLNGRPPNRCWLMLKRLPAALVEAARQRQEQQQKLQQMEEEERKEQLSQRQPA